MMLCAIRGYGIDGDESAFKVDAFWKRQNGGDFVGFFVDCLLAQHQPAGGAGGQRDECLHRAGVEEARLPLQADWLGSRTVVAMGF